MHENEGLMQLFVPEELPARNAVQTGGDFNAALLKLLAMRTERYTMGESSSVTVEMAQTLLESIRYTLALGCEAQGFNLAALPADTSLPALLLIGQAEAERRVKMGQKLFKHAKSLLSDIDDPALQETLSGIGQFFKRYDLWFFAHDIPCAIDYILDTPISEDLQGIDYVNTYLRALMVEGRAVPLRRKEEEARLNALLAQEEFQYTEGEVAHDDALRSLIEELNDCRCAGEKAALVTSTVRSLRDMTEVLDVCFWEDESIAVFELMGRSELALLYRFVQNRSKEKRSPTGWEQALTNYISDKIKTSRRTKTP
ncbi:DUF6179 domain-containing protein [Oscillospiraceae bacterium LTW-04]|nr:DUF6179 domain-containing protein [Oscillospiraceae bacterium MB24-C1]